MTTPEPPVVEVGGNLVKSDNQFWNDFRERAIATFWQGAIPVLIVAQPTTDWSQIKVVIWAAIVGGGGAVLSMAKSLWARNRGIRNSASVSENV